MSNAQQKCQYLILMLATSLTGGCIAVNPQADHDRVREHVQAAIGRPCSPPDLDKRVVQDKVALLLADGLTTDECVQIALLNNPAVRAGFARIGMARADVVQSGLLSNPNLGIELRFPEGGGRAILEMGVAQNIAELWMIPSRKRAAERDLDRSILQVAREIVSLAFDTKLAYLGAVASDRSLEFTHESLRLVEELHKITQARFEAGTVGALDVNLVRGLVLRAQIETRNTRLTADTAKRTLATLLGLQTPADDLQLSEPLPSPLASKIDPQRLVEIAYQSRLDVQAARQAVEAAESRVRAEHAKVFQNVEMGLSLEREDELSLGPLFNLTLPIFDQNQAQIAKARFVLDEAHAILDSLQRTVEQETRTAADRVATAWEVTRIYEQDLLPQARNTRDISEKAYQAGQTPILNVVEAQRSLIEILQAYVASLQGAANALVDLERSTAQPAQTLFEIVEVETPSTQPTSPQVDPE